MTFARRQQTQTHNKQRLRPVPACTCVPGSGRNLTRPPPPLPTPAHFPDSGGLCTGGLSVQVIPGATHCSMRATLPLVLLATVAAAAAMESKNMNGRPYKIANPNPNSNRRCVPVFPLPPLAASNPSTPRHSTSFLRAPRDPNLLPQRV